VTRRITLRTLAAAAAVAGSQGLLLAGFAAAGRVDGVAAAAACGIVWLAVLALALPGAVACLTLSLALGVLAALAGAPGGLTTTAAGASIAAWDLTRLAAGGARGIDAPTERRLLRSRLRALAAGILPGVVLAGLLRPVRIDMPFVVLASLALLALLTLDQVARRSG
jgi:hypothetical protein